MKKTLVILGSVLLMAACTTQKAANIDGEWNIVKVGGTAISVDAELDKPFLGFDTEKKTIYGTTSCNRLTGSLNIDTDKKTIDFGATGSTRMMCHDMETERMVLDAMAKSKKYEVKGNTLQFADENGNTVMELEKK